MIKKDTFSYRLSQLISFLTFINLLIVLYFALKLSFFSFFSFLNPTYEITKKDFFDRREWGYESEVKLLDDIRKEKITKNSLWSWDLYKDIILDARYLEDDDFIIDGVGVRKESKPNKWEQEFLTNLWVSYLNVGKFDKLTNRQRELLKNIINKYRAKKKKKGL